MRVHALCIVAASLALATGCGRTDVEATIEPSRAPVRVALVEQADVSDRIEAVGRLETRDEYRLAFKIGGVIAAFEVDAGDKVTAGQVLARLEQTEIDAAVARASEAAVKARRDLDRGLRLQADDVIAPEQVEDLTTALRVAEADLRAARFDARYARIEAPADGLVLARLAEPSELVGPGQTVIVLASTASGWVLRTALADRDVVRLAEGAAASVTFDAFPGRTFAGRVSEIATLANPGTGTFDVEIGLDDTDPRFASGLVGRATLDLAADRGAAQATLVPVAALFEADAGHATVFVVDEPAGLARAQRVPIGALSGDRVIVLGGLAPGARVVTEGGAWLDDAAPVTIVAGPRG
ncbi:MAG TPA: efflux RND transporter periplasmic adaptor subunit [Steroidobacteraceae bacterium]|nr:efflux RND transporter periplasmic adaptor subunit [Steroidobacteraceae bacterium]